MRTKDKPFYWLLSFIAVWLAFCVPHQVRLIEGTMRALSIMYAIWVCTT